MRFCGRIEVVEKSINFNFDLKFFTLQTLLDICCVLLRNIWMSNIDDDSWNEIERRRSLGREKQAVATFLFYSQGISTYVCSQPSCFLAEKWKCFHFLKLLVSHPSSFQLPRFLSKLFCIVKAVNDHIKFPLKHNFCIENCSSIKERQKSALHLEFSY